MTLREIEAVAQFTNILLIESGRPEIPARQVAQIYMPARRLSRLAVADCNDGLTDKQKRLEVRTSAALAALGEELGVTFTLSGDPRGYVVKMDTPLTGRFNTFGGAECGWGVA